MLFYPNFKTSLLDPVFNLISIWKLPYDMFLHERIVGKVVNELLRISCLLTWKVYKQILSRRVARDGLLSNSSNMSMISPSRLFTERRP